MMTITRYISSPMLYHGRKFDIRALVCVLDSGKVYWYDKVSRPKDPLGRERSST